jgi:hypothetical protein
MKPSVICAIPFVILFFVSSGAFADDGSGPFAVGADALATCCDACVKATNASETEASSLSAKLADLDRIEDLRDKFNTDRGHPRAVALLSPVCPGCIKSAELIQSAILDRYPESNLRLYVVWLPMVPGDARDRWDPESLADDRATHYWNGSRSIGKWFAKNVANCTPLGPVAWDVIYLFGPNTEWGNDSLEAESCPTPAYRYPDELAEAAQRVLGGSSTQPQQ